MSLSFEQLQQIHFPTATALKSKYNLNENMGYSSFFSPRQYSLEYVLDWLNTVPFNYGPFLTTKTFESYEELEKLLEATKGFEISITYINPNSAYQHSFAGISGILPVATSEGNDSFFTVYGHSGAITKEQRTSRTFTRKEDIVSILREIGIIGGEGYLVINKGDCKSVHPNFGGQKSRNVVFSIHTHPKTKYGFNHIPSDEENNSLNNPNGGDYAWLENRIMLGQYGRNPNPQPLYLILDESSPNNIIDLCRILYSEDNSLSFSWDMNSRIKLVEKSSFEEFRQIIMKRLGDENYAEKLNSPKLRKKHIYS